ncbi:DUF1761 domain-containing protein [Neobacillus sp.]|uniref:DUF1761 domain-containing protein n=1 Tax=Neobacillus sp. TaxID=2675273 RepID=UPI0028968019|nr:DUF1761 domain-containing protein [Neobacillus sp.]
MSFADVSILAIILAVVANMVIGALWYSPLLFATIWVKALGKKKEDMNPEGAKIGYSLTTLGGVFTAVVLSLFIHLLDIVTILDGALIGFLVGLVAAFRELSPTFFESRKYTLFFISAGYHIVSLTIMGIIIAAFA